MKVYLVGGAVRDIIMGITPKDRDYVVVGSSEAEMLSLGYSKVGADFPVFLHPETGEEYALARTERKTGTGYNGFSCETENVSLIADCRRRDLTMNSIAMDLATDEIIDPFGGINDIANKIIRHTSDAFSEDPLRVLRVARFVARYNFDVAEETKELCKQMIADGALESLSNDRIWKEFDKIFDEEYPIRATEFLVDVAGDMKSKIYQYIGYPHYFVGIDYSKLTKGLKMYFWLNLCKDSLDEVHELKIPVFVYKECKFYQNTTFLLFNTAITLDAIVNYYDKNKNMILGGYLNSYLSIMKEIDPQTQYVIDCINKLMNISWDFLADCNKKDIPEIVRLYKLKVISE